MRKKHRDSQKRIYIPNVCYFLTTNTLQRYPYFMEPIFCEIFMENLKLCKELKGFELYGWFLGYDHIHLQIKSGECFSYSGIMHFLKRNFSHNINLIMGYIEGADNYPRLQFRGILKKYRTQFLQKYPHSHPFPQFRWQKSYHDHYIRDEHDFMIHLKYLEYQILKHNMSKDWKYTFLNPEYEDLLDDSY